MPKHDDFLRNVFVGRTFTGLAVFFVVLLAVMTQETWGFLLLAIALIADSEFLVMFLGKKDSGKELTVQTKWMVIPVIIGFTVMLSCYWFLRLTPIGLALCLQSVVAMQTFDVFAYVGGKSAVRVRARTNRVVHLINRRISPGKTWEGAVIGLIFGLLTVPLTAWMLNLLDVNPAFYSWKDVGLVFIALTFGHFGDFFESWIKRKAGVKDSGRMLGGHGGVADRFDAVTACGLALTVFYLLGWF